MTEDQPDGQGFSEPEDRGYIPPDTGMDSNLAQFLEANKIDFNKLGGKVDESNRTPEEQRALGILKAVSYRTPQSIRNG